MLLCHSNQSAPSAPVQYVATQSQPITPHSFGETSGGLLLIRFSALGDVALLVPVVQSLATTYPDTPITVLTRQRMTQLFANLPANVHVKGINLNNYKGIRGLNRLYQQLAQLNFDAVADLHDVLRTKYLRLRFRLAGTPVAVINKGRAEKKALIHHGTTAQPLTHTIQRYANTLQTLNYPIPSAPVPSVATQSQPINPPSKGLSPAQPAIGIAPFAAHQPKIYPLQRMRQVAEQLAQRGYHIYLFGAGEKEKAILESWEQQNITSVCGKLSGINEEMKLMQQLKAMIAMDSANMHIAALTQIPVISIWGPTHPKAGFTPWKQPLNNILQDNTLTCRPCSIYGKKTCQYQNYPCMNNITTEQIINTVINTIHHQTS